MDDPLPLLRVMADHCVFVGSARRCVFVHEDPVNPPEWYVFLYVKIRTPSLLPQLELPLQTDVLNESHALTVIVTKLAVNALGWLTTA